MAAREQQDIRKAAAAASDAAKERALEDLHGGPAGLKRKREDDANEAKIAEMKKLKDLWIEQMAAKVVDMRLNVAPLPIPAMNAVIPKPQAKTMFDVTDTGLIVTPSACKAALEYLPPLISLTTFLQRFCC